MTLDVIGRVGGVVAGRSIGWQSLFTGYTFFRSVTINLQDLGTMTFK